MLRDFCYQVYQTGNGEIPGTLEDTGLSREKLKAIAQQVQEDSNGKFTYEGSLMVLEHAWSGSPMEVTPLKPFVKMGKKERNMYIPAYYEFLLQGPNRGRSSGPGRNS